GQQGECRADTGLQPLDGLRPDRLPRRLVLPPRHFPFHHRSLVTQSVTEMGRRRPPSSPAATCSKMRQNCPRICWPGTLKQALACTMIRSNKGAHIDPPFGESMPNAPTTTIGPYLASTDIAYFTMEIALRAEMHTYSGGLGVLAGDTARSCADLELPIVFVSLISRQGYL